MRNKLTEFPVWYEKANNHYFSQMKKWTLYSTRCKIRKVWHFNFKEESRIASKERGEKNVTEIPNTVVQNLVQRGSYIQLIWRVNCRWSNSDSMLAFDIGTITVEPYHGTTVNTANEFYSVYSNPSSLAVNHRYRPTRMRLSCLKVAVILSRVVVV